MTIRYRYAFNRGGDLIDIHSLEAADRYHMAPYHCPGCGGELIPRLGHQQAHHFAHTAERICTSETYLHQVAKQVFQQQYLQARQAGTPLWLTYPTDPHCTFYQARWGFTCHQPRHATRNLLDYFDHMALEHPIGPYRTDVLLSSTRHPRVVLIEFAVTHRCTVEKRTSGYPIIEIDLPDEAALARLTNWFVAGIQPGPHVRFYQFKTPAFSCDGDCQQRVNVFVVYPSGKSVLEDACSPQDITPDRFAHAIHYQVLGLAARSRKDQAVHYRDAVRTAHFAGVPVYNCWLCVYHGAAYAGIFCRFYKKTCRTNTAVQCPRYRPFPTLTACHARDHENAVYRQRYLRRSASSD